MAESKKLVRLSEGGSLIGTARLGGRDGAVGSVKQNVHDGDTIFVAALANISLRFLGVDTPEISFNPPGSKAFVNTDKPVWVDYLSDPFSGWDAQGQMGDDLVAHLQAKVGPTTAANHHAHAKAGEVSLQDFIQGDLDQSGGAVADFELFLRCAYEALDRYGRLLAYVNVSLPKNAPKPLTYNERQLQAGKALPYFIWPNLDPFKKQKVLTKAVPRPVDFPAAANNGALGRARQWVRDARSARKGVFDPSVDPGGALKLEAFELRFLARQAAPDRWVLDLTGDHGSQLIQPTGYLEVPNPEDRLFIPSEFVELFTARGWQAA